MRILVNWLLTGASLMILSEFTDLIQVLDFATALKLAIVINLILFVLRVMSGFLKIMGCLTFGISYVAGLVLSLMSLPIAFVKAMPYVRGYEIGGYKEALIVSVIMTLLSVLVFDTKKSSRRGA